MKEKIIGGLVVIVILLGIGVYFLKAVPQNIPVEVVPDTTTSPVDNTVTAPIDNSSLLISSSRRTTALGEYLTDGRGMTLYVSADDKRLASSCTGDCAKTWIPYAYDNKNIASSTDMLSKRMNVIKRPDGTYQYAYGEKPVYFYVGDKAPGDTNGNGLNAGKWSVVGITK
ncbi:hypothetical protein H0W91_02110 [Patescibacteria group bacterium]|nr:hypothetical protein [Patescibacteria group bacterium]